MMESRKSEHCFLSMFLVSNFCGLTVNGIFWFAAVIAKLSLGGVCSCSLWVIPCKKTEKNIFFVLFLTKKVERIGYFSNKTFFETKLCFFFYHFWKNLNFLFFLFLKVFKMRSLILSQVKPLKIFTFFFNVF